MKDDLQKKMYLNNITSLSNEFKNDIYDFSKFIDEGATIPEGVCYINEIIDKAYKKDNTFSKEEYKNVMELVVNELSDDTTYKKFFSDYQDKVFKNDKAYLKITLEKEYIMDDLDRYSIYKFTKILDDNTKEIYLKVDRPIYVNNELCVETGNILKLTTEIDDEDEMEYRQVIANYEIVKNDAFDNETIIKINNKLDTKFSIYEDKMALKDKLNMQESKTLIDYAKTLIEIKYSYENCKNLFNSKNPEINSILKDKMQEIESFINEKSVKLEKYINYYNDFYSKSDNSKIKERYKEFLKDANAEKLESNFDALYKSYLKENESTIIEDENYDAFNKNLVGDDIEHDFSDVEGEID